VCKPASMIICDGGKRCVWSANTDSHEEIIAEFMLNEGTGRVNFVRVEISPKDANLASDPATWKFATDQDTTPDWYDAKDAEKLARAELTKWIEKKIVVDRDIGTVESGQYYLLGSSKVEARGSSTVEAWGSSTVEARDSSTVEARGSSKVEAWDSSTVEAWDSSKVVARGSSTVESINDNATLIVYVKTDKGVLQSVNAVLVDRSGPKVKCCVGKQKVAMKGKVAP